jgi:hypothetical protein
MPSFWLQQWHQFIFDLATHGTAVFLGTLAIGVFGVGPIGRALAARIRGSSALPAGDPSLPEMKAVLGEVLERLDFSERVLTELHQRTLGNVPVQTPVRTPREVTPV